MPLQWQAGVAEYAHYESVFNVIAQDTPTWAICPYDAATLPDEVIEHAWATHPEIYARGVFEVNPGYVDPEKYCTQLAGRPAPPHPNARRFAISSDFAGLRAALGAEAEAAGVLGGRLEDLLLAVHEVVVNAVLHGEGPATLSSWTDGSAFVCEVENTGPTVSETTAGYVPLDSTTTRGRGLWMVRQLCDLVEIQSRHGRTSVRLSVCSS